MTDEEYSKSISTGELQLSFRGKMTHYGVVGYLLFTPIALFLTMIFKYINNSLSNTFLFREGEIFIFIGPLVFAFLFFLLQKQRLKFKVLNVKILPSDFKTYLQALSEEWEWIPVTHTDHVFTAKTKRGFFSGSWGEQVTVLRTNNSIFINSVCDPDKRSSVVSFGHNRENVNAIITLFNNVSKLPKAN